MLVQTQDSKVNILMEDTLGIVYLIENAQQFWSELEDILRIPNDNTATLSLLDAALRRFVSLCASYHEQYLQSPMQLEHSCDLLLDSELFQFHSERMCELLCDDVKTNTDPHSQLIIYTIFLFHGRRKSAFLRSHKRWQPLLPLLMDHVLVEMDAEAEDLYLGTSNVSGGSRASIGVPIPIEAKLRQLSVNLLYEVCRVQKFSLEDLRVFDNTFLDHLFDLVEQTKYMQDETFNYSVIKLIVALNEQFMVASLPSGAQASGDTAQPKSEAQNRVLNVLIRRLGHSMTFGENMIFMLNRAGRTAEDLCMQLLILKLLYLLFSTKGTSEYFYTNDLCVLVDVFLRELADLDEESESLRHTYLRVLNPLLTKTQLRSIPYKRPQIVLALESLVQNADIRDIDSTTKRLVERCLSGDWCLPYIKAVKDKEKNPSAADYSLASPSHEVMASVAQDVIPIKMMSSLQIEKTNSAPSLVKPKALKPSKSVENLKSPSAPRAAASTSRNSVENLRRPSVESASSLGGVASASFPFPGRNQKAGSDDGSRIGQQAERTSSYPRAPPSPGALSLPSRPAPGTQKPHRRAAPPPPKRRKPPAIPAGKMNGGATITVLANSSSTPSLLQFAQAKAHAASP